MSKEFVVLRKDGFGPRISMLKMLRAAKSATKPGRPYQLIKNGRPVGNMRQRYLALAALARNVRFGRIGATYALRDATKAVFRTREAKAAVKVINTSGNRKVDVVWSYVKEKYPDSTFLGAYVCKSISGSSTPSQHSYGNAADGGAATMAKLNEIAEDLVRHADEHDAYHIIVDDRIWTRGSGWSHYGGDRHYHWHWDGDPQYSGGCGVRG